MADQVGRVLDGRYRLLAPIGAGGSAAVYSADDVRLRRRVAVKILHADLADDESFLRRFRAEAQAVAALAHPNILSVFDWGEEDGNPYLVMELLGGGSLRNILDRGDRLTPSQALQVGLEAARALDYAHRRGLVHRDVKPANLLFDEEGRVRIADFGLARALAEASITEPTGAILGTFRYASPEQALGKSVDGKADVYALALVLTEAVTGQVPFAADTPVATLMARVNNPLEAPPALGALAPVLVEAGVPDPDDRLDAASLITGLERVARTMAKPPPLPLAGTREIDDTTRVSDDITVMPPVAPVPTALFDGDAVDDQGRSDRRARRPAAADRVAARTAARDEADSSQEWDFVAVDGAKTRRRRRRWPWIVLAVLLLAGAGTGGAIAYTSAAVPSHLVPGLTDKPVAEARRAATSDHFKVRVIREEFTEDKVAGTVLAQSPLPSAKLKEGRTISVVVSKGAAPRPVPDLAGTDEATAVQRLKDAGLVTDANVQRPFSEDIVKGKVMDWTPKGVDVAKGSPVVLTVSNGPEPRKISDWRNHTFDEAAAAFAKARLNVKRVDVFDDTIPAGKVVSTNPPANATSDRDSTVTVNVSKGPSPIPDVRGKSVAAPTTILQNAGSAVVGVGGPPEKVVRGTTPPAGTQAKKGTQVTLVTK